MEGKYYTKWGFGGLSLLGKIVFLLIFAGGVWLSWQLWVKSGWSDFEAGQASMQEMARVYGIGLAKMIGVGLLAAYVVHFILPKKFYERQEFYCADCGAFIGYKIGRCGKCRSNKYTTDAEMAQMKREKQDVKSDSR
jgi:hypothetical protein